MKTEPSTPSADTPMAFDVYKAKTVGQLIMVLQKMPMGALVSFNWDGDARSDLDNLWLSSEGIVVMNSQHEPTYSYESRPVGAPTEEEDPHWKSGENITINHD